MLNFIVLLFLLFSLFGFPEHYTDIGNIAPTKRLKILAKSWSVAVIKEILRPLKAFFVTEDLLGDLKPNPPVVESATVSSVTMAEVPEKDNDVPQLDDPASQEVEIEKLENLDENNNSNEFNIDQKCLRDDSSDESEQMSEGFEIQEDPSGMELRNNVIDRFDTICAEKCNERSSVDENVIDAIEYDAHVRTDSCHGDKKDDNVISMAIEQENDQKYGMESKPDNEGVVNYVDMNVNSHDESGKVDHKERSVDSLHSVHDDLLKSVNIIADQNITKNSYKATKIHSDDEMELDDKVIETDVMSLGNSNGAEVQARRIEDEIKNGNDKVKSDTANSRYLKVSGNVKIAPEKGKPKKRRKRSIYGKRYRSVQKKNTRKNINKVQNTPRSKARIMQEIKEHNRIRKIMRRVKHDMKYRYGSSDNIGSSDITPISYDDDSVTIGYNSSSMNVCADMEKPTSFIERSYYEKNCTAPQMHVPHKMMNEPRLEWPVNCQSYMPNKFGAEPKPYFPSYTPIAESPSYPSSYQITQGAPSQNDNSYLDNWMVKQQNSAKYWDVRNNYQTEPRNGMNYMSYSYNSEHSVPYHIPQHGYCSGQLTEQWSEQRSEQRSEQQFEQQFDHRFEQRSRVLHNTPAQQFQDVLYPYTWMSDQHVNNTSAQVDYNKDDWLSIYPRSDGRQIELPSNELALEQKDDFTSSFAAALHELNVHNGSTTFNYRLADDTQNANVKMPVDIVIDEAQDLEIITNYVTQDHSYSNRRPNRDLSIVDALNTRYHNAQAISR